MQFSNDADHRPLTHVAGINGTVHAVDGHVDSGLVFCIIGTFAQCDARLARAQQLIGLKTNTQNLIGA